MLRKQIRLVKPLLFSSRYQELNFNQIIVKPKYLAICHADQRYYQGTRSQQVLAKKLPMSLIHEAWGEIIYDPGNILKPGDKVFLMPTISQSDDPFIEDNYYPNSTFLSSGHDGFIQEYLNMPRHALIKFENIDEKVAALGEFLSVCDQSINRFLKYSHSRREKLVIIGDGSLAFSLALVLRYYLPSSHLTIIGRSEAKLNMFSFADEKILSHQLDKINYYDHGFEVCGGEGSIEAIDNLIKIVKPQATIMLMGVSEYKVAINTRDILEKGLSLIGTSRSNRENFQHVANILQQSEITNHLKSIISFSGVVKNIDDLHQVFKDDLNNSFKTVFKLEL